ncbi:hypothetical protein Bint_0164 [Brachyspira intermedia PWS/A]|uniref:Lipoprotein n=1 Tax=Brachyspira intermedia (strain ATCC 51140 / PWS/A) TaxID=1045858 RepID=G0EQ93_BRAIP|nr:hypothetical protein [Brachyspira intermedia]AEM20798.1 hypothetical protein Bint_0164 [Brachyspira intermedia PWS/A]
MKKTAILLSLILSAFIISSCAEKNPNNPNDNSNNIPLSERAGKYTGTIAQINNMSLEMILNNTGSLTSLKVNNEESLDQSNPINVGDSTSKSTTFGPFNATIKLGGNPASAQVQITFKSGTDKTLGASVDIDIIDDGKFDPSIKDVILNYQAN